MANLKKVILVAAVLLLAVNAWSQPPRWALVYSLTEKVSTRNIKAYTKYTIPETAATSDIDKMQKKISDATIVLRGPSPENQYLNIAGSGIFIRTPMDSSFICLLSAGHNFRARNAFTQVPATLTIPYVGFRYRRTVSESWGINFNQNITYAEASNVTCKILGIANFADVNGVISDYALLAFPKSAIPFDVSVYQAPYDFPQDIVIPTTTNTELFVLHHSFGMPQRLSELSNAYADASQNRHAFGNSRLGGGFWYSGFWSNGSMREGSSGSGLIRPSGNEPQVVGITVRGGPLFQAPQTPQLVISLGMTTQAQQDAGYWINYFYKLSQIEGQIRAKCGCTNEQAKKGVTVPGIPLPVSTNVAFSTQSSFVAAARQLAGIGVYLYGINNMGISAAFNKISAAVHAQGNIRLQNGFSADSKNGVFISMGILTSSESKSTSSARVSSASLDKEIFETADDATNSETESTILNGFKVYPSPSKGILNISAGHENKKYVAGITDINGNAIYKETNPAVGNRQIDISSKIITGGVYLVKVLVDGETKPVTWKIVIIK